MSTLLSANNIVKSYKRSGQTDTLVLKGATLSLQAGELVAIVGPSGAGKSTLLHVLATLDTVDSGTIELMVDGKLHSLHNANSAQLAAVRKQHIGMVFQFHHLLPEFTALENIMMPLLINGISQSEAKKNAEVLLERVGMQHREKYAPSQLSGGEQQRIAIARALVHKPTILFADEPTGNLDSANAALIADLLLQMQAEFNIACVIATHSADLAKRTHRTIRITDGICLAN